MLLSKEFVGLSSRSTSLLALGLTASLGCAQHGKIMSFANLCPLLGTTELLFAAEEVEGPASPELVEEELSEPDGDSLAEDFNLKENSLLLRKPNRHIVTTSEQ